MGRKYVPPEEMAFLKELIPEHLHKWLDYVSDPEPEDALTPGEELNGLDPFHDRTALPTKKKRKALVPPSGPVGPQVILTKKPRELPAPKVPLPADLDVQKTLLEMALSDGEEDDA